MSKKDFKDQVKAPDAFISTSTRVLNWIEKHARAVVAVVVLACLVGAGLTGYSYWQSSVESRAAEAIYKYEAELKAVEARIREERGELMREMSKKKSNPKDPIRPVDYEKDYAQIVGKLKNEIKAHRKTRTALISALNLSYFLVQQKRFEEALEVISIPSFEPSRSDLLAGFTLMHKGLVLIENGKADEAIETYQRLLDSSALKAFHSEALLKQGIAWELKGDLAKAKDTYENVARSYPNTDASTSASQFLRLLELKSKPG